MLDREEIIVVDVEDDLEPLTAVARPGQGDRAVRRQRAAVEAIEQLDFAKRRISNNFQLASRIDARQRELIEEQRLIQQMMR